MKTATTSHHAETRSAYDRYQKFPALELVTRPTVPTEQAAYYLNRRPQTLRSWAMRSGTGPISCLRINGRLAWNVSDIRTALGVAQ